MKLKKEQNKINVEEEENERYILEIIQINYKATSVTTMLLSEEINSGI